MARVNGRLHRRSARPWSPDPRASGCAHPTIRQRPRARARARYVMPSRDPSSLERDARPSESSRQVRLASGRQLWRLNTLGRLHSRRCGADQLAVARALGGQKRRHPPACGQRHTSRGRRNERTSEPQAPLTDAPGSQRGPGAGRSNTSQQPACALRRSRAARCCSCAGCSSCQG